MAAIEYYPLIRQAHLALAVASVGFFVLRGGAVFAGHAWPLARGPRVASMAIDTGLLAAGATLWAMLGLDLARDGWLAAKLALVLAYIVAGTFALRRARTRAGKAVAFALALAIVAAIVAIARAREAAAPLHAIGL